MRLTRRRCCAGIGRVGSFGVSVCCSATIARRRLRGNAPRRRSSAARLRLGLGGRSLRRRRTRPRSCANRRIQGGLDSVQNRRAAYAGGPALPGVCRPSGRQPLRSVLGESDRRPRRRPRQIAAIASSPKRSPRGGAIKAGSNRWATPSSRVAVPPMSIAADNGSAS